MFIQPFRMSGQPTAKQEEAKPTPAVSIRKSITPDYLISLEDGKQYKSLKRHLTKLGLTPEAYREKWDLPRDYPMVAANYAAKRSELAKSIGLGQMRSKAAQAKAAANDRWRPPPQKRLLSADGRRLLPESTVEKLREAALDERPFCCSTASSRCNRPGPSI